MKSTILAVSFGLATLMSVNLQAADEPTSPSMPVKATDTTKPCMAIRTACQAAGFVVGDVKSGKGLMENCMKPIINGQTVNGVTVNQADIDACKAKGSELMNKVKPQ